MSKRKNLLFMSGAFGIPFLIMLAVFIVKGIFPFGDRSFLCTDLYHQYMPFFNEFVSKVKAGEGLSYSYNVGIGSNFLALYTYYLASPLHWLAFLVPQDFLIEFISYLAVVKVGLCGLTAAYYLQKHYQTRNVGVLFFSCFYALSGFTAAYSWNIMWLDCIILLPLIVYGLELLVKENKCTLYCVTLGLSIFTNFYISIMICIFLVLYFGVLLLTQKRSLDILRNFVIYSLLAAGMAAILLIPVACALMETDFGDMNFPAKAESYFSVLDMLARHGMCVDVEKGLTHWPNIYCGAAVFMMVPMYVLNQKISIRERFSYLALAGFMLLGFSTNVLNFIWHGMNYPDSLPARQSFIYILLILMMCYGAYHHMMEAEPKYILYGYLCAAVFLLFCEEFTDAKHFSPGVEWLSFGFITVYAILLYLYRTREDYHIRQILAVTAMVAVMAESGINIFVTGIPTVSRTSYLEGLTDYAALYETAKGTVTEEGQEPPFFRIEKFTRKTKNDGTLVGYPTASVFSSTMNSHVMDMYKKLGMLYSKVYYGYDGATFFTSALLNVQFMYGTAGKEEGPLYTHIADSGNVSLYQSQYTLPFGYVAPFGYDVPEEAGNGLQLQNQMISALGVNGLLFTKYHSAQNGEDVQFTANDAGYYYGVVAASGTSKIAYSAGGNARTFSDLKNKVIMHLGYLEPGTVATLTNGNDEDETQTIKVDIYRMDEQVLKEALELLGKESMYNVTYDSTHIKGEITLSQDGRLILSVPYEKGWTVLLDGEEVTPQLFGGALMALELGAGYHVIEMHYVPYGTGLGIAVSMISIGIFVALLLKPGRMKRQKAAQEAMEAMDVVVETM